MAARSRCPECGTSVKLPNLASHYARNHPGAERRLSKEERRVMKRAALRRDRPSSYADWRLAAVLVVVVLAAGIGLWAYEARPVNASGRIAIDQTSWNFGDIGQDVVTHTFRVRNAGTESLRLEGISTSCMCTSAAFTYGSATSPRFGQHNNPPWQFVLEPGTEGLLTVFYDPTVHPERGHFERDVYILSSDPLQREARVTIHVNEV